MQHLAHIALVVKDYDEAIQFYTQKLGFTLIEDTKLSEEKRWVLVNLPEQRNVRSYLQKPRMKNKTLRSVIKLVEGFFFFLHTDNFSKDYERLIDQGVNFVRPPQKEEYGTVAVFEDLYGNLWDLIEPNELHK